MARLSSHLAKTSRRAARSALVVSAFLMGCPASTPRVVGGSGPHDLLEPGDAVCEEAKDDPRCRPEATHERVELINHLAGCRPGPRGKATFLLGDEVLAELSPGQKKSVRLPRGDTSLTVKSPNPDGTDHVELVHLSLGGKGPVPVEVGCPAGRFASSGLSPLVLWGPAASCPPSRVRASGLDFELGAGLSWTLLVPLGDHVVKFGTTSQTVSVGPLGASLTAPACGGVQGGRPAPRAARIDPVRASGGPLGAR